MYPLCLKKQSQELLLQFSFKVKPPTNRFQNIFFLVSKSIQMLKDPLRGHQGFLTYLRPKFSQFQS